jgi:hypothetical protein
MITYLLMALGIVLFGVLALLLAGNVLSLEGEKVYEPSNSRAVTATYVGSETCSNCHADKATNWGSTKHGQDFSDIEYHGESANKFTMYGGACISCHVIGYNQTEYGGFDPAFAWNSTENEDLLGIGCENCHGPGSEHVGASFEEKKNTINLIKDPYFESCGGTEDAGCHGDHQYGTEDLEGWTSSVHAPFEDRADTTLFPSDMNTYCASCKSPSQAVEGATYGNNEKVEKADWRGVTCADCHDPHPDPANSNEHQLRWEEDLVCDQCHQGTHHENLRTEELADTPSVNRDLYPFMDDVNCVDCHMFNTPRGVPEELELVGHTFEPKIEACVDCHTTIYEDMPDDDYPHENWTAWEKNLEDALETWGGIVESGQERYEVLIAEVESLYEEVEELEDTAKENGTWTEEIENMFHQAEYDLELVDHKSKRFHNPAYATALLEAAKDSFTEILEELGKGILTGTVTDTSGPISDVFISANGNIAKTGTDGTYTLKLEPGTYTITGTKEGVLDQTKSGIVIVAGGVVTQNFTLAADLDNDGTADTTDEDDDDDGMPDSWESENNLKSNDSSDAFGDPDNDERINLQEYIDGTDPQKADSIGIKTDDKGSEGIATGTFYGVVGLLVVVIIILIVMMMMKGKPEESISESKEVKPRRTAVKKK